MKNEKLAAKRCLSGLLILIAVLGVSFSGYSQTSVKGDVNKNGGIDIIDALLTAQYSAGIIPAVFDANAADVNCDSAINILDALLIARYSAHVIPSVECTPKPTCNPASPCATATGTPSPTCSPCTIQLTGSVIDSETSLPIQGAVVTLRAIGTGSELGTPTDENGNYRMNAGFCDTRGGASLMVSKTGYQVVSLDRSFPCGTNEQVLLALTPDRNTPSPLPAPTPAP